MAGQIISNRIAIHFVLLHAHRQRLDPAQHQKALERGENASGALLHEGKSLFMLRRGRHQNAAQTITVAIEKFGGGVHHDIRAKLQRALKIGRHEGVVDAQVDRLPACPFMTDIGDGANVGDLHHRVGRGFNVHQPGIGLDRTADLLRVGGIDVGEENAVIGNDLVKKPRRSPVNIGSADHVIAGLEHGDQGRDRRHPARKNVRRSAAFERSQVFFERRARGFETREYSYPRCLPWLKRPLRAKPDFPQAPFA